MTFAPRHRYTLTDYLEVEEQSAVRHEFLGGEIYAMAGWTPEHAALCAAVMVLLGPQLREGRCRLYSSDLRLRVVATGLATYPDAAVVCGEVERDPQSPTHVLNPTVVIEVLSPSTEEYDRGEKREHYQRMPALQHYVVIAQGLRRAEVWSRVAEGWLHATVGPDGQIDLAAVGARIDMTELYATAGVDAPPS